MLSFESVVLSHCEYAKQGKATNVKANISVYTRWSDFQKCILINQNSFSTLSAANEIINDMEGYPNSAWVIIPT